MKFNLGDFMELGMDGLLVVNGGSSCSSSGSSSSSGSTPSTTGCGYGVTSSNPEGNTVTKVKTGGGSCSGIAHASFSDGNRHERRFIRKTVDEENYQIDEGCFSVAGNVTKTDSEWSGISDYYGHEENSFNDSENYAFENVSTKNI